MPEIQPFRGIRYDLGHVGSLADVVAPPYDVIDPDLQDRLYERHPANVIRLILNRDEPGDAEDARYERAARFFRNWQDEGVLTPEGNPAIYVYHQTFEYAGQSFTRRGFMARVRLQRFGEGNIYPHEETHSKAKADRLKLTKACRANMSQIFGIYPDPENAAQELLQQFVDDATPIEAVDHLGVRHSLWPVTDIQTIGKVASILADKPMFVADGHHRYETACNYRDFLMEKSGGSLPADHPANFVMTMFVSMSDPGMIVLPTHRLFSGIPAIDSKELIERIGKCFTCNVVGKGAQLAGEVWQKMEQADDQGLIGLYTAKDDTWTLAEANEEAQKRMAELAPKQSEDWRSLGVSLLHRLLVDDLLNAAGHPKPTYVHRTEEVVQALRGEGRRSEEEASEPYALAALVMPAQLEHVEAISLHRERMPAKSTYFFPKLLSGLVFHSLQP